MLVGFLFLILLLCYLFGSQKNAKLEKLEKLSPIQLPKRLLNYDFFDENKIFEKTTNMVYARWTSFNSCHILLPVKFTLKETSDNDKNTSESEVNHKTKILVQVDILTANNGKVSSILRQKLLITDDSPIGIPISLSFLLTNHLVDNVVIQREYLTDNKVPNLVHLELLETRN